MKKKKDKTPSQRVYEFNTKSEYGFTWIEIEELLSEYPDVDMEKFNDAMMGNTCMMEGGWIINYPCDVLLALNCGIEQRKQKIWEWD